MFLKKQELEKEPYAGRITQLREFCQEQKHTSIPKLLDEAAAFGGIREDVLGFFEKNRELGINREMFVSYLCFLTSGEEAGAQWYELIKELAGQKEEPVQRHFFHEVTEAFQSGVPYEAAAHALECTTVYEFQCYHKEYTEQTKKVWREMKEPGQSAESRTQKQEASMELQKKIFDLENDVRYYRRLYQELHFEMDRTAMSLMEARRENRRLKQELEACLQTDCREEPAVHEKGKGETCWTGDGLPPEEEEERTEYPPSFSDVEEKMYGLGENTEIEGYPLEWDWYPKEKSDHGLPSDMEQEEPDGYSFPDMGQEEPEDLFPNAGYRGTNAPLFECIEKEEPEENRATGMEQMQEKAGGTIPEIQEEDRKGPDSEKGAINPILLFTKIVQSIRMRRFQKKKEADRHRELAALMNQNRFGPEQQKLVLSAMDRGAVPMEELWGMVYQGFTAEQIREGLKDREEAYGSIQNPLEAI